MWFGLPEGKFFKQYLEVAMTGFWIRPRAYPELILEGGKMKKKILGGGQNPIF